MRVQISLEHIDQPPFDQFISQYRETHLVLPTAFHVPYCKYESTCNCFCSQSINRVSPCYCSGLTSVCQQGTTVSLRLVTSLDGSIMSMLMSTTFLRDIHSAVVSISSLVPNFIKNNVVTSKPGMSSSSASFSLRLFFFFFSANCKRLFSLE